MYETLKSTCSDPAKSILGLRMGTVVTSDSICRWPLSMRNVRKLPIVGDVHLGREEWPSLPEDWEALWNINPQPIRLSKITYSVNTAERCFNAISLSFREQKF